MGIFNISKDSKNPTELCLFCVEKMSLNLFRCVEKMSFTDYLSAGRSLSLCMDACVYMCLRVCAFMYLCVHVRPCAYMRMCMCEGVCMSECVRVFWFV